MKAPALLFSLLTLSTSLALAHVKLPAVFSDHMVLQRDREVPVWGTGDAGEEVTVSFGDQKKKTKADDKGAWQVRLTAMPANAEGRALKVSGSSEVVIKDVLVGEVWICSGQSNMAWKVQQSENAEEEIANANFPQIRQFKVSLKTARRPQEDCEGEWFVTSPDTVGDFTAVGYFFGRELHQKLNVPIGLINTSWGGTRSEAWTSRGGLRKSPKAQPILDTWTAAATNYDPKEAKEKFEQALVSWELRKAKAKEAGKPAPRRPQEARHPLDSQHSPSSLYNAMIHPLVPYGIRGAIWYQGESNQVRAKQYRAIFPAMIRDWRSKWKQGAFPFYFVQLANFRQPATEPGTDDMWAELQEAQLMTLQSVPKTGMAIINDIGTANNIHPPNKQEVGRRLARWAFLRDYEQDRILISGPVYKEHKVEGDKVRVEFLYTGRKLKSRDGDALKWFEIAGEDQKWRWAEAVIDGKSVVVSSPDVPNPVAVRYAWTGNPVDANLVNADDLPASLFRTDKWDRITKDVLAPPIN